MQSLARRLEEGGVLSCAGISAAAQPFLAALLRHLFPQRPIVVVTEGLKPQESAQQDLATWLALGSEVQSPKSKVQSQAPGDKSLNPESSIQDNGSRITFHVSRFTPPASPTPQPLFYPSWEVFPHEVGLPHADVISERLETLVALTHHASRITRPAPLIVTSVVALLQRTFPAGAIRDRTRTLTRGDHADPLDLVEWLEAQGYEPEAQVTQKGELALHGGILDIYPLTSPWPVRLEFFGDELESLRQFDPLTQMSREEIGAVTIPPAGELGLLKKSLVQSPKSKVQGPSDHDPRKTAEPPIDPSPAMPGPLSPSKGKRAGERGPSIEPRYTWKDGMQGFTSVPPPAPIHPHAPGTVSLGTLLDYLPAESILLLCEPEQLAERADEYAGQVPEADPFFIPWETFLARAGERGMPRLELSEVEAGPVGLEEGSSETPSSPIPALSPGERIPQGNPSRLAPPHPPAVHPLPLRGGGGTAVELSALSNALVSSPSPPREERAGERRPIAPGPLNSMAVGGRGEEAVDRAEFHGEGAGAAEREVPAPAMPEQAGTIGIPHSALRTPHFESLEAFRPLPERPPEPPVAEAQRREFFAQLHRWLRQGYAVHVFCNNDGERQRFTEIWDEYGLLPESPKTDAQTPKPPDPAGLWTLDYRLWTHLGTLARGFLCDEARLVVVTDAEIFGRYKVQRPRRLKSPHAQAARSALDIDFTELEEGDYVVHLQHGIGRYIGLQVLPLGAGTKPTEGRGTNAHAGQECLVIEYASGDPAQPPPKLYVPVTEAHLVSKYVGTGKARPPLNALGGTRWAKAKAHAERAVRDVAGDLLSIQAARESQPGHPFAPDAPWQREFESAFIFEETPDQQRAIVETKADMERPKPMDRLICGDVGFGKTEVGIRAAFKAVMDGKQVAVLVPTTVLAQQHYNTFRERMADYPIRVELLSRFRTRRAQEAVVRDLAAGSVDIVIGTHRLLQNDIVIKDLGLVVIDEEQRFGVMHKEKFKMLRRLVDVLTLSATPIPRTLYLALTGARDMSTIQTPPHDRLPVETIVTQYDERVIRDAIQRELNRGGQVFFLHNRVLTIQTMAQKLSGLLPHARIVVGHGQMHSDELEEVMTEFVNGEADVLLSTTIIESGLDIPNANTIIIDRADRFGLSDLYQLRGRVGRYKHQAYAYLLLPRHGSLLTDVRKRLSAIKQYSTLGSGFKIAMRDLEIRGAGNLLGAEQSGHITAVGFELYCQLLKQSVAALKGEKVKPRVEVRVNLDFLALSPGEESPKSAGGERESESRITHHASAYIPFRYIADARQRIEIYRKLAQATDQAGLKSLKQEMRDRFGPLPPALELLLRVAELKVMASERGITVIEVQDDKLMLTRNNDYVMVGNRFPRLTKKQANARLKEIAQLLTALSN